VRVVTPPLSSARHATDWLRTRIYASCVGAFIAFVIMCATGLWYHYHDALGSGRRHVENLTYILGDHLHRSVEAIDATLAQLNLHSQRVGGPNAGLDSWKPVLAAALAGLTGVGSLSIVDEKGTITHSTIPSIVGQSRRDLYVFRYLSSNPTSGLVADTPFNSLTTGQMLIPLGRRLVNQHGEFVGIAVATLEPSRLREFYRSVDVGPGGVVWVLHPAGHVLFRAPSASGTIDQSARDNPLFAAQRASPQSGFLQASLEPGGPTYLSAYRTTGKPPLIVAVSLAERDALARWWREAIIAFVLMLGLAAALSTGGFLIGRERRARAAADTRVAEADTALRQEIEERRLLFETTLDLILITDRRGTFLRVSPSSAAILGHDPKDMIGHSGAEFIYCDDLEPTRNEMRLARRGRAMRNFESRYIHKQGRIVTLAWSGVWSETEQKHFFIGRDRTEQKVAEEALRAQNLRFDMTLTNMPQGLCVFDADQRLVICNERYLQMYGLSREQAKPGTSLGEILQQRIAKGLYAGASAGEYIRERFDAVAAGRAASTTHRLSDGRIIAVSHQPVPGGGWITSHEDITERCRMEAQITHMAHHDALTGLPNRLLLRERLQEALKAHDGKGIAVLCLDLDRFKEINDTLGHSIGDELLKAVAERLRSCVRETDTVARSSGDEFVVVQSSVDPSKDAAVLAARIFAVLSDPFDVNDNAMTIGTSIGIAVSPNDGADPDNLLKHADLALYRCKSQGRGSYCYFEHEMNTRMQMRRTLEQDLRKAITDGEFELFYQPLLNLARNEISGFEALLRWRHPKRGMVPPAEFIPLAEETGLIVPIGEWVLRQACAEAACWPAHIKVAVNLSAVQFKSHNLVQMVVNVLARSGLAAKRLELEVTESVLLQDNEATLNVLRQLHDLGVRIALDDFGTGYSSLSYLRSFPFDKIKIDRCFVSDLSEAHAGSLAIVRAVVGLGGALGIATTAEGVETKEQMERAHAEGCTEIQGYFFSRPQPAADLSRLFFANGETAASAA
jgi:diguanylate cyclase (GGDEF)-like protein/PAS domain S-box-containing protein